MEIYGGGKGNLDERVTELEEDNQRNSEEYETKIKSIQCALDTFDGLLKKKLEVEQFNQFKEEYFKLMKLELIQKLHSYADKGYVNNNIEKQSKTLVEMILRVESVAKGKDDGDAMFVKKGFQCASCEKGLTNYSGTIPDYQPWSKMPGDRIARISKGFSKKLGQMRLDTADSSHLTTPFTAWEDLNSSKGKETSYKTHREFGIDARDIGNKATTP